MLHKNSALIVITSHSSLGKTGQATGVNLYELATAYWQLSDAGFDIDLASVHGGKSVIDPATLKPKGENPYAVQRFLDNDPCMNKMKYTVPVSSVVAHRYRIVFLAGGHGAMWDFAQSGALANLVSLAYANGAILAAIGHGVSGLLDANNEKGQPIVDGLRLSGFSDAQERANRTDKVVPFLLESRLRAAGAVFESGENFLPFVVSEGYIITGQNSASMPLLMQTLLTVADMAKQSGLRVY